MVLKIETKFNIGQTVYVLDTNCHCIYFNKNIDNIRINIDKDYFKIAYKVDGLKEYYEELYIFKTIEELGQRLKQLYFIKEEEDGNQ